MKTIHWLVPYENPQLELIKNSNLASIRLRLSAFLNQKIYKVTFGDLIIENPDFIVIGKIGGSSDNYRENLWLDQINKKKESGTKIILDYTDNHLNFKSSMSSFYSKSLLYIDAAIASSAFLSNELKKKTEVPVEIIPDVIEIESLKPRPKQSNLKKIFWFGHASNIDYLIKFINNLNNLENKIAIYILSNEQGLDIFNKNQINISKNLSIHLGIWSIDAMINTAKFCDLAIIPSDPNDPKKAGVSSNRLITALALGLPTAADGMESYKEFSKYFTDIRSEKFIDLLQNPNIFHDQVTGAQENIIPNFTYEAINKKWVSFFSGLQ